MRVTPTHIRAAKSPDAALGKVNVRANETSNFEGAVPMPQSTKVSYYDAMLAEILHRIDAAGMTRKDVAGGLGISTETLRRKLKNDSMLMLEDIRRFAVVLGCRMSDLMVSPNNDESPADTGHSDCV